MTHDSSQRGVASYFAVALLAAVVGASAAFLIRNSPPLDAVTTHGEWIWIKRTSDSLRAYVAYPERRDAAPAVIVIHEIFGLTDWEPTVGDKLAANGYVAIVPDMLSSRFGITPPSPDSGRKLMAQLTPDGITDALSKGYSLEIPACFECTTDLWEALKAIDPVAHALYRHAAGSIARRMAELKRRSRQFGDQLG